MANNDNFIVTADMETAAVLRKEGYKLVYNDGKSFVFLNDDKNKILFGNLKDIRYTNTFFG